MSTNLPPDRPSFYARRGRWVILALVLSLPVVLYGLLKAAESNNNNIKQWLPTGMEETEVYREFRRHFGSDEFAIVSWDGCTMDDPRLEQFARRVLEQRKPPLLEQDKPWIFQLVDRFDALLGIEHARAAQQEEPLFLSVTTGPRALEDLLEAPYNSELRTREQLTRDDAIERLHYLLVGRDGHTTAAVVKLSKTGDDDRTAATRALRETALEVLSEAEGGPVDPEVIHLGGETVFNAVIDTASQGAINQLSWISGIVALVVALVGLRSVRLTLMVFVVAVYTAMLAESLVHYTGSNMNLVLVVMPVLVYVLALSAGVHLVNYYRDAVHKFGLPGAPNRAVAQGWVPCTLAAATTAVGLASLNVSHVEPVKKFGQFGALGVLASLAVVFLVLPSMLQLWPLKSAECRVTARHVARGGETRIEHVLRSMSTAAIRLHVPVVAVCLAMVLFFAWNVQHIKTSVKTMRFFPADSKVKRDADWFEKEIGAVIPLQVVIEFDHQVNPLSFVERMKVVHAIERNVKQMGLVGGTISAATYAPPLNEPGRMSISEVARQKIVHKRIEASKDRFIAHQYLAEVTNGEGKVVKQLWRINVRVEELKEIGYDEFLGQVQQRVDAHVDALPELDRAGMKAIYTGAVPLVYVAQNELLDGLYKSFLLAFALIGLVMVALMIHRLTPVELAKSVVAGMIAMLPNIFPAVLIFGWMGWRGIVVDVGSMLTASVAMGIAVDDTLHFLTWFRRALYEGASRREAIVLAFQRCSIAMTQTTAIAGLGLVVFSYSDFQPVSQFGLLMFLLLIAALIGDLVFLPALLASRLGVVFERQVGAAVPEPEKQLVS